MINSCQAILYDGRSSQSREVTVHLEGTNLRVCGEGIDCLHPLQQVRIDPRLGKVSRMLRFSDGATADTKADAFLDQLLRIQGNGRFLGQIHRWEVSPQRVITALVVTILMVFCLVRYGVPLLVQKVAFALPAATEEVIGRETLQILDKIGMKPSEIPQQRRHELKRLFDSLIAGHPERKSWRLELRSAKTIGANAFALPSGIVIMTDRLVEIAKNDDEIAGVLAHEIGHLTQRHALRHLLQNSATVLVVATLTGDIVSVSSFAASMPMVLIDAKYSRDFEREADAAAVSYLKEKGISVRAYAEILARLDADHYQERGKAPHLGELLDNHPLMLERIKKILAS
jgi:Zn-dependent protease with chaperone function